MTSQDATPDMTSGTTPDADGTILTNNGPWGGGGNQPPGGGSPWGQGPRGGGNGNGSGGGGKQGGPDIDDMLRQAQERFRGKMGGGRGGRGSAGDVPPQKVIGIGLLVLALLWLGTGFYRVEPGENALVMTFGEWKSTRSEPGLGYHLPAPFQAVEKIDVAIDRKTEIGGQVRSMILTGDENIIDINFVVFWRIADAAKYQFKLVNPALTVEKVAESAMREIIGRTQIQRALTEGRTEIELQTKDLMQKILDEYAAGVTINNVQLLRVDPPTSVVDAFNDVQRARTDLERMRNEAETYRNDIVPRARGDAQKLLQDAEGYKQAVTSKAQGESERFLSVYKAYAQSKDITQKRIYLETMQDIMKNSRKIIVGDDRGVPVLPYMQLEQPKAARAQ